jgi:phage-related tail protein
VIVLVLIAALLGAGTALLGPVAALVGLGLSTAALFAAAVMGLRAQWLRVVAEEAALAAAVPAPRTPAETMEQLRGLRERYVAAVDTALDEGDLARARELADAYSDDALRVLTH